MIKLIAFDLDGVLVDTKKIHFEALNYALNKIDKKLIISYSEHLSQYDGLPTNEKLKLLTLNKKLLKINYIKIKKYKDFYTAKLINRNITKNKRLIYLFRDLSKIYKIAVASNAIKKTVLQCLSKLEIRQYVDLVVSNEDVKFPKPNPQIFLKCIINFGFLPKEVLVLEDSFHGRKAALDSGSNLRPIEKLSNVNKKNINHYLDKFNNLNKKNKTYWESPDLNILIPMAGEGIRFKNAGYSFPKPLIEVNSKPMIQVVTENLKIKANFIFLVRKEHMKKYNLSYFLNLIAPNCQIVEVDKKTNGAASTTLLAQKFINNKKQLLIVNSDQFIKWNSSDAMYSICNKNVDGAILTFKATHPKWSFAKINNDGFVDEVAEKKPISNDATCGIYFWNKGSEYVKYAKQMIQKNIRTNNEFYICPVYNEAINDNKKIINYEIDEMWGLGTPEDLDNFLKNAIIS